MILSMDHAFLCALDSIHFLLLENLIPKFPSLSTASFSSVYKDVISTPYLKNFLWNSLFWLLTVRSLSLLPSQSSSKKLPVLAAFDSFPAILSGTHSFTVSTLLKLHMTASPTTSVLTQSVNSAWVEKPCCIWSTLSQISTWLTP